MPVAIVNIKNLGRIIKQEIYHKVANDVAKMTDMPNDRIDILYNGIELVKTDNHTNVSLRTNENRPTTVSKKRLVIDVNTEYDEEYIDTTAVGRQEYYPVFRDNETGVTISPVYLTFTVEMTLTYHDTAKSALGAFRDKLRLAISNYRNIGNHEVEYSIFIPNSVEDFIIDVWELKNRLKPQELSDYFLDHATNRFHLVTDMSNEGNTRLAIREKQVRIPGFFDFSPIPNRRESDNDTNEHKIEIGYKFNISVPRALSIRYPVMIFNRMLPSKYLSVGKKYKKDSIREKNKNANYIGYSNHLLSAFEAHRLLERKEELELPINLPEEDHWMPGAGHNGYKVYMSFLVEVDETDRKTLLDLNDLGDYYLPDCVINYIKGVGRKKVTTPYTAPIYFGLWQEGKFFDAPVLTIDDDLIVRSKTELSLYTPVRVTLSILLNLTTVSANLNDVILEDKDLFVCYMSDYVRLIRSNKRMLTESTQSLGLFYRTIKDYIEAYSCMDSEAMKVIVNELHSDSSNYLDKLLSAYPTITNRLKECGAIDVDSLDRGISMPGFKTVYRNSIYPSVMKTSMANYIIGLRQEEKGA